MKRTFIAAALAVAVVAPSVASAGPLDDAIKARRGYFQLVKLNFGQIIGMLRGDIAYDPAAASAAANNMAALAGMHVGNQYPAGSDNYSMFGDTRAQPNIWSDAAGYQARFAALGAAVSDLAAVADQGRGALGPRVAAVGATCKGCHDNYRASSF